MSDPTTIDSSVYKRSFFGILNAQGQFWTPLAFESEAAAAACLAKFVAGNPKRFSAMLRTHKVVPVRIKLETIPAPSPLENE